MDNSKNATIFYIVLLVALFVALYIVLGGDFRFWQHWESSSGGSILDGIINSVGSVGEGLTRSFSSFFH